MLVLLGLLSSAVASDAILINFTSPHCGPCRAMKPTLSELERAGIPVRHVDVTKESSLAHRYGIRKTPTYVIVAAGKELTRLVGIQSAKQLMTALRTNPSGRLVQTGSQSRNITGQPDNGIPAPLTRLAPLGHRGRGHRGSNLAFESRGSSNTPLNQTPSNQTTSNQTLTAAATAPALNQPLRSPVAPKSEAMPSLSLASAVQRAQAATVRLRVHDGRGYGAGTGTIIDVHGDEALVLTCGHLFR